MIKNQYYKNYWVFALPLIAVCIWSLNIAVTRYVTDYISPVSISFYRWLIAFVILTPFLIPQVIRQQHVVRANLGHLAVLSAFGMVLYQGIAYTAAHYTSATNMGIINAFIPVFTIVVSILILKEFPNRFAITGSMISFCGLVFVITQGQWDELIQLTGHMGDALMLLAVFFYAFYGVLLKKWQLAIPLVISLYIQIFFAVLYHLPLIAWFGLDGLTKSNIYSVVYAGIFPSLIAPFVWMAAVQRIGPTQTSIFMNLMPVVTVIIAYIWLKEAWTIYYTLGGVMILVGILITQRKIG